MSVRPALCLLLIAATAGVPHALPLQLANQTLPPGNITATGRVLDDETGAGVVGVPLEVAVLRTDQGQSRVYRATATSRENGRFEIPNLPAGAVTFRPTSAGYLSARVPSAMPIAEGDRVGAVEVRVVRPGEIRGRVLGADGVPLANLPIRLFKSHLPRQAFAPLPIVPTDREGRFAVRGLAPGEYLAGVDVVATTMTRAVADAFRRAFTTLNRSIDFDPVDDTRARFPASTALTVGAEVFSRTARDADAPIPNAPAQGGESRVYRTTFHPSATSMADAGVIKLKSGGLVEGVEITMRTTPPRRVSGRLTTSTGPAAFVGVRLIDLQGGLHYQDSYGEIAASITDEAGAFSMAGVPEGRYRLRAFVVEPRTTVAPTPRPFRTWIEMPVDVATGDVTLPPLEMRAPYALEGQFVFNTPLTGAAAESFKNWRVRLQSLGPMWWTGPQLGTVDENGRLRRLRRGRR